MSHSTAVRRSLQHTLLLSCPGPLLLTLCTAGTSGEELEHLEGVISRVCNFHVADTKPMQVHGPDQVQCGHRQVWAAAGVVNTTNAMRAGRLRRNARRPAWRQHQQSVFRWEPHSAFEATSPSAVKGEPTRGLNGLNQDPTQHSLRWRLHPPCSSLLPSLLPPPPSKRQVLGALGKELAKLVFGGGSSSSKAKDNTPDTNRQRSSRSPSPRHTDQQQQQQQQAAYSWLTPAERERAEQARSEKERFDYLSALEARRGTHVASAGTQGYGASVPHSHLEEEEGEDVPTAPKMVSQSLLQLSTLG